MATTLLWWSYASIHLQLDESPIEQILMETVRNERALLVFAILSTIIMVSPRTSSYELYMQLSCFYKIGSYSYHQLFLMCHHAILYLVSVALRGYSLKFRYLWDLL